MEFFCDQFWFCNAIPPEWHWVMPLGMPLLLIIVVAVPVANILHRAGRSRWWTILAFVPLVNLVRLWVFAFTRWPDRALAVGQKVLSSAVCPAPRQSRGLVSRRRPGSANGSPAAPIPHPHVRGARRVPKGVS